MRKIALLGALLITTTAFATQFKKYDDIIAAIQAGKQLRIVTNFDQCTMMSAASSIPKVLLLASFTPSEIGGNNAHIAAASNHFTINDPLFPGRPVFEFARYTITPDKKVNITLDVLDAKTYDNLGSRYTWDCTLDVATKVFD